MADIDLQTENLTLRKELELISRQNSRWMVLNNLISTFLQEEKFEDFLFSFLDGFQIMIGGYPMVFMQEHPNQWQWIKKDKYFKISKTDCMPHVSQWLESIMSLRTFVWSLSDSPDLKNDFDTPPKEIFFSVTNMLGFTNTVGNYKIIVLSINIPNPEYLLEYSRDILDLINPLTLMLRYIRIHNSLKVQNIELDNARLVAESANRAKSDFLANISHDLRTPLNGIMGFAEILRNQLLGTLNFEQLDALNEIVGAGTHLTQLIEDLLDMSRIEVGKLKIECKTVSIRSLLEKAISFFQEKARLSSIHLHLEYTTQNTVVNIDERRMYQVILNLLSNAIKYSPQGGDVGIIVSELDFFLKITIWDTGIGISQVDLPKLFQPFQRIETVLTKNIPGTGLGLNYSKKLVELHGGSITVESEEGHGSRFHIILKREKEI